MKEFSVIFESTFLYEVEIIKSKLLSEGIECSINNEFVNNVAVMPMSNFYQLIVKTEDLEQAKEIIEKPSL